MIGKTISQYKIVEKLGEGGMGVVYRAEDTKLDRTVAIKFLPRDVAASDEERERFKIEAKAAAALNHPHIATVHNIEEADGETFIVMEYVKGRELRDIIASGPLAIDQVLAFASQIAGALEAAHEEGVVHRDIKPANIMATEKHAIKIMDFGLAKRRGRTKLTKEGTTVGTAAYMSPEQARGDEVDGRSDIWSFGVLLYEMITGQLPFKGDYEQALVYSLMNEEPEAITGLRTGVPLELERVVFKALAKDRDERYQSVADMAVDLKMIAKDRGSSQSGRVTPPSSSPGTRKQTLPYAAALLVLCALIVAALVFMLPALLSDPPANLQSVAVLPFDNLSQDPDQDYFVAGMHEALILDLSKVNALKVISRTSVMRYRATDKTIPEIARELGVDAVIEGSVLRVGDTVRITAQLINGISDEHIWAESYDRDLKDVLFMISGVARAIVEEVRLAMTQDDEGLLRAVTIDPEAYDLYLRGRFSFNTITPDGIRKSIEYYREAIAIDSSFAQAWASLGSAYILQAYFGMASTIPEGDATTLKALEIDDRLPLAYTSLAWSSLSKWQWPQMEKMVQTALELNPNDPYALHCYGDYLTAMGRAEEGLTFVRRGRDVDPFSAMTNVPYIGHLYAARQYDALIVEARKLTEMDAAYEDLLRSWPAAALWQMGRHEEAVAEFRETRLLRELKMAGILDRGYAEAGPQGAMAAVAQALDSASVTQSIIPVNIAEFYARAGDVASTLQWLEQAMAQPAPNTWLFAADPVFDLVRGEPRFKALLRRMNLPTEN